MLNNIIRLTTLLIVMVSTSAFGQKDTMKNIEDIIAPYKYEVKYAAINDTTKMAYIDEGQGKETLIFILGLATYLPSWNQTIDGLKGKYRCIAVDLPGYGRSSKGYYPAKITFYASVLNTFIERLELEKPILVGHSMGGQVAVTTVLQNPNAFEKLILLAPAGFETFSDTQKNVLKSVTTVASINNATEQQIRANWKLNFFDMPESVQFMIEDRINMKGAKDFKYYCQSIVNGVVGMLDEPIFDKLHELDTETLVVYGANDALIPNKFLNPNLTTQLVAESGAKEIHNSQIELIKNCGHFLTFDQAEEVNRRIINFLN